MKRRTVEEKNKLYAMVYGRQGGTVLKDVDESKARYVKREIQAIRMEHRDYEVNQRVRINSRAERHSVLSIEEFDVGGQMGFVKWYRVHFLDKAHGTHEINGVHVHVIEYSATLDE